MALNLNKGGDNNSNPNSEKKGFNLSKSGDSVKTSFNLSKDENAKEPTIEASVDDTNQKKKSPAYLGVAIVAVLGVLAFWYFNRDSSVSTETTGGASDVHATATKSPDVSTASAQSTNVSPEAVQNAADSQKSVTSDINTANPSTSVNSSNVAETSKHTGKELSPSGSSVNEHSDNQKATSNLTNAGSTNSLEEKAKQVILGKFGNGTNRKRALGKEYSEIQAKVNEIYISSKHQ
jgi:hypothetical protein